MWTLIIILSGGFGATSMSADHVDGFVTPKACNQAAALIAAMNSSTVTVKTGCIFKPLSAAQGSQP